MNTYEFFNPVTCEMETVETKRELTAVLVAENYEERGYALTLTSRKNPAQAVTAENRVNRPWLSSWEICEEFKKIS